MPKRKASNTDGQPVSRIESANDLDLSTFKHLYLPPFFHYYTPTSTSDSQGSGSENPTLAITLARSEDLESDELNACFDLIESTSGAAYRSSSWGWHPFRKRREMREEDMRYLLVRRRRQRSDATEPVMPAIETRFETAERETTGTAAGSAAPGRSTDGGTEQDWEDGDSELPNTDASIEGFLSFMLTHEDGFEVVYIYEIHLRPALRSLGLGAHLMKLVEHLGHGVGVQKSMLTCFRSNEAAEEWYRRRGYEEDENSPREKKLRGGSSRRWII
ncbi:N alpha-acetyl-transferase [Taxawa tesnikishii (nom. ined.)]|nr:N alpha-acetyl-transferase [Dothideales sp. JES 119]